MQTEALQERWPGLVLCSDILYGPSLTSRILIPPDPCSRILHRPDFRPRILHGPDPSALLNGPGGRLIILQNQHWCTLHRLYSSDFRSRNLHGLHRLDWRPLLLLGCPGLKLLQQGSRCCLAEIFLVLIGGIRSGRNFVAGWRAGWCRRQVLSVSG